MRQGFIVISAGGKRVEGQIKLVFPAKFEAGFRHGVIANLRARMPFRQVSGVGSNLIGDKPLLNIFFIGQTQMLFWRYVTEHRAAKPANHRRTNPRREVVIARRNIGS
ncbi:hypothetical protein EOS_42700 [Caballeronia mineralivorans PML1(12)]|uniref:Uncharacterized protein n=1 Tax=Caballeronia mineralivorans PML1(12) TaxID=908627 RepID=A0A0J1CHR5_9BURK|nr:hypothetical protein EOS_42700 [Caballeronia mineralivorans PML1(12)]